MEEISALTGKPKLQDIAHDVTIFYSLNGKVQAKLEAVEFVHAESAHPPYVDMNKGIRARFFDDSLNITNTLSAKYGRYYELEGNILLRDSVVVVNSKGERLETEELVWNQKIGKYYTEKPVTIITPTQTLHGDGLEASQDFSWYQILHPHGSVAVEKGSLPE